MISCFLHHLLLILTGIIVSCSNDYDKASALMDDAEKHMYDAPDSALHMIRSLDISSIGPSRLKARHALLHSMLLDRNYIDVENDSIIAPALSYYLKYGTPDDKIRTLYYWGRILQNAGREEDAVKAFVKILGYEGKSEDNATFARCCSVLGLIYSSQYDFRRSIDMNEKAAYYYDCAGNINLYVNSILKIADALWCLNRISEMDDRLKAVEPYMEDMKPHVLSAYYSLKLRLERESVSFDDLDKVVEDYIDNVPEELIEWHNVALSYLLSGNDHEALQAVSRIPLYNVDYLEDPGYYALKAKIEEAFGKPSSALESYKRYIHLSDSIDMVIYSHDTKFIQERYEKDMSILRGKNQNMILSGVLLSVLIVLCVMIYYLRKRSDEKKIFREMLCIVEEEKTALTKMIAESPSNDPNIKRIIGDRLDLLNEFILGSRIASAHYQKRINEKIHNLITDTKEYLSTIGMTYVIKNPDFVHYLKEKGLTTWEIGYCCLYVMGYSAKEISGIMLNNQVYKISSAIRGKLEIGGGKKRFETIINELFHQFSLSQTY